jgi:hypothetical protein
VDDDIAVLLVEELHLYLFREAHNPFILAIYLLFSLRLTNDVLLDFSVGYFAELTVTFMLEVL